MSWRGGIWLSERGGGSGETVAEHEAKADPHPQYEARVKNNLTAATPPATTDDTGAGYELRSLWFDTQGGEIYRCMDASAGAAKWVKTSLTIDELGSAALADAGAFDSAGSASGAVTSHEGRPDPHGQYVQKEAGKSLSSEDYTSAEKSKLAGIAENATGDQGKGDIDALGIDAATLGERAPADFATSAQGAKADTAAQRAGLGTAAAEDKGAFDPAGTGETKAGEAVTAHEAKPDPHDQYLNESRFDILVRDVERAQFEAATGGQCTIERTPNGQSSYMFVLPKSQWEDLLPGKELGTGTHEAFIENGVEKSELLIGMHMASKVNGELVSQPGFAARHTIDWDASVSEAQAVNMQVMSNWEWSFLSFWCMANGFQPRGNTDYGISHSHPWERGVYDGDANGGEEYTLTGSGPNTWRHNKAANGIADLVGNKWEWQRGVKMVDGRIFMAPDNNPALAESAWVDSGWDMTSGGTFASQDATGAPQSVKRALLMPNGVADPDGRLYTNLSGERFPRRGGARNGGAGAGLGALVLASTRSNSHTAIGLRLSRLV